jgi:hypothetical protein
MAANYEVMPLAEQLKIMLQEAKNTNMLEAKSSMWRKAGEELGKAGKDIGKETTKIEPDWTDAAGKQFVERARNTKRVLDKWHHNITTAKPDDLLKQLSELIPNTYAALNDVISRFNLWYSQNQEALAKEGYTTKEQAELYPPYNWRRHTGSMMNRIADLYGRATKAVDTASSGGKYEGVNDQVKKPPQRRPTVTGDRGGGGGTVSGTAPTGTTGATPSVASADLEGVMAPRTDVPGVNGVDPGSVSPANPFGVSPNGVSPNGVDPAAVNPAVNPAAVNPAAANPQVSTPDLSGTQDSGANPELAGGLGTAPQVSAPNLPPATGGTAVPPVSGVGTPFIPPVGGVGGGGGSGGVSAPFIPPAGGGPGGGGPGGLGSGGVKLPGVSLPGGALGGGGVGGVGGGGLGGGGAAAVGGIGGFGGGGVGGVSGGVGGIGGGGIGGAGGPAVPAAATPVQPPATTGPAATAPGTPPGLSPTAAGGTAMGGGGVPPMMPPMGMGGGMGAGGGPGSGTASRPTGAGRNNRRKDVVTPGLPVMLSGKAGWADVNAFAGRGRRQAEESDVPTTVQLIDEDLWQIEQKPAADERVAAPVRRAH